MSSTAVGDTKTAKYPTKLRRNYPRSRNGCLTCRQRKKKCDETRPQCVGCARNKLSCVWPARSKTAAGGSSVGASSSSGNTQAGDVPADTGRPSHPCPLLSSSNLTLYQHKSRWQTYLPSLAAWEGVEGCSVNLNPAYDEAGYRRDAVAVGLATAGTAGTAGTASTAGTAGTPATTSATIATDSSSTGVDDADSVQPLSSSNHNTDMDDYATTATTTTADDDDRFDMYDDDELSYHDDEYTRHLDGDHEDNGDNAEDEDEDEDAILAAWSPALASFTVDAVPPPPPKKSAISAAYRRRQRPQHPHQQQNQHQHQYQQQEQYRQRQRRASAVPLPSAYPIQRRRVAAMTPLSSSMLRHYIVEAAPTLATCRAAQNPYVAAFLPLAYTDDLVMHCVLAIGGAHLSNRLTKPCATEGDPGGGCSPFTGTTGSTAIPPPTTANAAAGSTLTPYTVPDVAAAALHDATTRHYTCVLRSLRSVLRDLQPTDSAQVLRVLAVLLLLATYECLSWNILGGGVFAHLRASRQLIGWLRNDDNNNRRASLSPDERSLLGALLEIYAYQVLANRVCPDASIQGRSTAGEDTASHDDEDFVADPSLLQDQECFGLLFSGLHGLFALIPPVSRLAAAAIQPQSSSAQQPVSTCTLSSLFADSAATTTGTSSLTIAAQVASLRNRALAWQLPAAFLARATGDQERIWQRAIGEVYRHGLLIYLETIKVPGADTDANTATSGGSAATFQRHIHALGEAVLGADLVASRFASILLWPLLIAGSILAHPEERVFLAEGLRASPQATWSSIRAADVLEQLWARRDGAVLGRALTSSGETNTTNSNGVGSNSSRQYYGPHGIAQIMRETNVNLCVG